jgi:pyruvate dehydrogenase E1 component
VHADVWSVTSWTEPGTAWSATATTSCTPTPSRGYPTSPRRWPTRLGRCWMRVVPDLIRPWVPSDFSGLGTHGFGISDTRPATRRHFAVDAESITVAALAALARRGEVDHGQVGEAASRYRIDDPRQPGHKPLTQAWPDGTRGWFAHPFL